MWPHHGFIPIGRRAAGCPRHMALDQMPAAPLTLSLRQLCGTRGTGAMRCVTRRSDCTTGGIWRASGGRGGKGVPLGFPAQRLQGPRNAGSKAVSCTASLNLPHTPDDGPNPAAQATAPARNSAGLNTGAASARPAFAWRPITPGSACEPRSRHMSAFSLRFRGQPSWND